MSGRFAAGNQVAIVGYAHSPVLRRADLPLGAQAVNTARAAIADAGLRVDQIDGFVSSSLLPTAGGQGAEDGISIVSSAWLAQHLGAKPCYVAGFEGIGQITGSVAIAVNAIASGAADYVLLHRALHNPAGRYHANPMREVSGLQQWTAPQGFFGPLAMIALPYNEYLQRYGASRESMAAVAVEARKNGARIPWSYWHDRPLDADEYLSAPMLFDPVCRYDCDIPVDGVAAFVLTSAERANDLPHRPGLCGRLCQRHAHPASTSAALAARRHRRRRCAAGPPTVGTLRNLRKRRRSPAGLRRLLVVRLVMARGSRALPARRGAPLRRARAASTATARVRYPALSGGGALGNGRMHGIPQMLECYLQLAQRAGDRQRDNATIGLACHSSPHFGGAVVYSATQF